MFERFGWSDRFNFVRMKFLILVMGIFIVTLMKGNGNTGVKELLGFGFKKRAITHNLPLFFMRAFI